MSWRDTLQIDPRLPGGMIFNKHPEIEGKHALYGASKYGWIDRELTEDAVRHELEVAYSQQNGTDIHALAKKLIWQKKKLPKNLKFIRFLVEVELGARGELVSDIALYTLYSYVNDAIKLNMRPEVELMNTPWNFGTCDCIRVEPDGRLIIHDLKTGSSTASMQQLRAYAALWCAEYHVDPSELKSIELHLYQNNKIIDDFPSPDDISRIIHNGTVRSQIVNSIDPYGGKY